MTHLVAKIAPSKDMFALGRLLSESINTTVLRLTSPSILVRRFRFRIVFL